ncbi:hypothetical protein [Propionivibrio dicarboxylicus]|uniref:Type IV pilus assembly protein PilN n=1 Tax=Propionivibrio dicarboxylicus TaxID=83767 RepID=A0A1G8IKA7_9RHOO|nr:hypothetical protein [Propionivibrio dicarboxylicus]SDI19221.1 hypothetical protein SAMN05660652_03015 [Propionivibrio dicarboxylicus]
MSQQINLYESRLRPRELLLNGRRLAAAFVSVLLLGSGWAVAARHQADQASAELVQVQSVLKDVQSKHDALYKQVMERKLSDALQNELDKMRAMLSVREEVVVMLDSGRLGNTAGFSELFRGFARNTTNDWWLTRFAVDLGGQEIEIVGKVLDAGKLPNYVQRLSGDSAFQGRRFAALTMSSVDPSEAKPEDAAGADKSKDKPEFRLPRHIEFVLRTENAGDSAKSGELKK